MAMFNSYVSHYQRVDDVFPPIPWSRHRPARRFPEHTEVRPRSAWPKVPWFNMRWPSQMVRINRLWPSQNGDINGLKFWEGHTPFVGKTKMPTSYYLGIIWFWESLGTTPPNIKQPPYGPKENHTYIYIYTIKKIELRLVVTQFCGHYFRIGF